MCGGVGSLVLLVLVLVLLLLLVLLELVLLESLSSDDDVSALDPGLASLTASTFVDASAADWLVTASTTSPSSATSPSSRSSISIRHSPNACLKHVRIR